MFRNPRPFPALPPVTPPKAHPRLTRRQLFFAVLLGLVLLSGVIGTGSVVLHSLAARGPLSSPQAKLTLAQFLQQGRLDHAYHGPVILPKKPAAVPLSARDKRALLSTQLPPSAEPATMQPISVPLSTAFVSGQAGTSSLHLTGSDQRLEVSLDAGSLDLSQAQVGTGTAPSGSLTLQVTQLHGHFAGQLNQLGSYQLQVLDGQQQVLSGIRLRHPLTMVYHYQPWELAALDLDPDHLFLTWPQSIADALTHQQATAPFTTVMTNDPTAHTLTAQTMVLGSGPLAAGVGDPQNQSPPQPHLGSVSGNAGQFTYGYPLRLPPGPAGYTPNLTLAYSSSEPNGRSSRTSPASPVGDGWSLSLGSISSDVYPAGSAEQATWYFLSDVGNVSDRLVQDTTITSGTYYQTEHISRLKIQRITSSITNQPCFNLWDTSGTYYQVGCTSDALQYRTDASGRTNYRWDVNRIMAPNEGPGGSYKLITISYKQDSATSGGYTSIRDAGISKISYGYGTSVSSIGTIVGTVDFSYLAPPYSTNYNCSSAPPANTTLRCDDPVTFGGVTQPTVMSTLSLQSVTSYVGDDSSSSHKAYGYNFTYHDTPYVTNCYDSYTLAQMACAGEHLLTSITPLVYQNGTAHTLKQALFSYSSPLQNVYYDSQNKVQNGTQQYGGQTFWQYLSSYVDTATGSGGSVSYARAFSNTHGTPYVINGDGSVDDRHDPLYCTSHSNCTGNYLHPEDHAWSMQIVTKITSSGADSSSVQPATTTYAYRLAVTGTYSGNSTDCYPASGSNPPPGQSDCVGDNWIPAHNGTQDSDWRDYYHAEFRGFNAVYVTSPAADLTANYYYSTEGWGTPSSNSGNANSGQLYEQDSYAGNAATDSALQQRTTTTYALNPNSCNGQLDPVYNPCEAMVLSSRTTLYDGTGSANTAAPWVQHAYTYDDFSTSSGLIAGYHNLTQDQISSANAPTRTQKWSYTTNDFTDTAHGNWVYYTVNKATHSELDDAGGHVWQCQDLSYDAGAARSPSAGWPTTTTAYSTCGQSGTAITSYNGYDVYGNTVATVDPLAVANSSLYSSHGCTFTAGQGPSILASAWTAGRYTSCATYTDGGTTNVYKSVPLTATNALGQQTSTSYDYTQGALPISSTDPNNQQSSVSYSYDSNSASNNKVITSAKAPLETGNYTSESYPSSTCISTSTEPCLVMSGDTSLYANASSEVYYDSQGRSVETSTPIATPVGGDPAKWYYRVTITIHNDGAHSSWTSVPFVVAGSANGLGWLEPTNVTDYQGVAPGGSATAYDALGRVTSIVDPLSNTTSIHYGLGSVSGDSATYAQATTIDANGHVTTSESDAQGRVRYSQQNSGLFAGTLTPVEQQTIQYNALDKPTSVVVTDLAPQSGQSSTSVTTTASYDDLGQLTQLNDPDKGSHTYSYDPDGRVLSDVSGTRTLGYNDDLLGRLGCLQDASPTINATGACTTGSHPLVQNTYDSTTLGTQGSTDFPVGALTQSVATTRYPEGTSATVTEQFQHDQRGRVITATEQLGLPSAWNVTTALPTSQQSVAYNDADQATTSTTSTTPAGFGYTTTQVYDANTGGVTGLSNNGTATANLATVTLNARGLLDTINLKTDQNTALASNQFGYDADLRPQSATATWQSGSGQSGTVFSQNRSYDVVGNVTSLATTQAAVPGQSGSGGSETQNFCYDEQNRLLWAGNSGTQPAAGNGTCGSATLSSGLAGGSYSASYAYTHLGQLWQGPLDGGSTQYQYLYCQSSHPHQLDGLYPTGTACASKSGQVYTSSYDAWGNVTSRLFNGTTATLSYDPLDHLVEWNASSTSQEWYLYDSAGNRVLRRSTNSSTTTLTTYPFGSEEHGYSSSGTPNGGDLYYYHLAGQLIGELNGTSTQFFLTDALGSVLATINTTTGSAAVQGNSAYDPYGHQRYQQGSLGTAKGFTGQYNDNLTGLDYYGARYYDQKAGVFLSADSVQGNLQGMNPYGYVSGNPETFADPTGQRVVGVGGGLGDSGGGSPTSTPAPAAPTTSWYSQWWNATVTVTKTVMNVVQTVDTLQKNLADAALGVSSMGHDIQTIFSGKASGWDRAGAGADLAFNLFVDINMVDGGGEVLRTGDLALKGTEELVAHGGLDGVEHAVGDIASGACSFTARTLVSTTLGKQAIGSLHVGDKVWAYNPKTHKMEQQPIVQVWVHPDHDLVDLTITTTTPTTHGLVQHNEMVHTNQKHPFLTIEKGFLPVAQIKVGMHVLRADGSLGVITIWKSVPGTKTMYNLEVTQDHTFTVGDGQWVVHNCGSGPQFSNDPSTVGHVFRKSDGHLTEDTPENRQLLIDTSSSVDNFRGKDVNGKEWFSQILSDGRQAWVAARNKIIVNAGVNDIPRMNWDVKRGIIP